MYVIVILEKFGFQFSHVHVRRAFTFARFARNAQLQDILNLTLVDGLFFFAAVQKFAQDISPAAG